MTDTVEHEVVAAVDLGGTRTKAALVDRDLGVVARVVEPTPADLAARIGETVASVVWRLVAATPGVRLAGCGVVVPGLVDEETGVGVLSVNHGWRDLPIRSRVEEAVGVPVVVGHDVRAGLVAEARLGAAVGARDALFLPLGTGIAAALMVDGHVLSGGGWAGELGHVSVDPNGPPCPCGGTGCLEVIASAAAVGREYSSRTGELVDAQTVAQRVVEGDPVAVAVWQRAVSALARAVHATLTLTGIDLVLVGGGLAQSGETLLAPLRAEIESLRTFQRPARIVTPALADWAGCLGAACLAWEAT
ncbi:MAG TPA: ROK family protein [Lapillicoccus sp.]|nr:ROK family protein [Lapillicoccus sp.]